MNLALTTAVIEALIFASSEPVTVKEIAVILEISEVTVKQIVEDLMKEYKNQRRGIQIMEVVDGYHFVTNPECAIYLEKLRKVPRQTPLSQAA
ncbi:MAG TPA: SMC-Scp complex subunit ScpB, partial [Firmicutes bacterium]|nr:SMC-Scp complex subunit ScpB [Bacillota bacterium]